MSDFVTTIVTIIALIFIVVLFGLNIAGVFCCEQIWLRILSFVCCLLYAGYIGFLIGILEGAKL